MAEKKEKKESDFLVVEDKTFNTKEKKYRFKNGVQRVNYRGSIIDVIHLTAKVVELYRNTPLSNIIEEY